MAVADQERQNGVDRGRDKHGVNVVEGFCVAQEPGRAKLRIEDLMRCRVEKRPCHQEAEDESETAIGAGFGLDHDLGLLLRLNQFFLICWNDATARKHRY